MWRSASHPWSDLTTAGVVRGKSGPGHLVEEGLPRYTTNDAMILEQRMTGTVIGSLLAFRVWAPHHVCLRVRNGLIIHENVWLDSAANVDQLRRR